MEEDNVDAPSLGFARERKIWIGIALVLLAVNVVLVVYVLHARREVSNYDANLVNCSMELEEAVQRMKDKEAELSGLRRDLNASRLGKVGQSGLSNKYIEQFKKRGLKSPVQNITADLLKHTDLIPYEGTRGRPMRFHNRKEIYLLGPNRVFANFGDGNEYGWMLLDYKISNNGEITWKVTESYCPYYDK